MPAMLQKSVDQDRREFVRLSLRRPVKFRDADSGGHRLSLGLSHDVSRSGLLFASHIVPRLSSIIWMELDPGTLEECRGIEEEALIYEGGLLGRVVRIEESADDKSYRIGVSYVTREIGSHELKF